MGWWVGKLVRYYHLKLTILLLSHPGILGIVVVVVVVQ